MHITIPGLEVGSRSTTCLQQVNARLFSSPGIVLYTSAESHLIYFFRQGKAKQHTSIPEAGGEKSSCSESYMKSEAKLKVMKAATQARTIV